MNRITLVLLFGAAILYSCTQKSEPEEADPITTEDIEGTWEMTAVFEYVDGDTIEIDRGGHRQVKMYTDGYVMWSRTDPEDSTQWYGWGGYTVENNTLKEWIEYGSHAFMPAIDPDVPFEHNLTKDGDTYVQIRVDSAGNPEASEHYRLISAGIEEEDDRSLEGVWEMSRWQNGSPDGLLDVDLTNYRQVKMYADGFVMWSRQSPPDSTEWFGFGKYSSDGGLLNEWMEYGSHAFMPVIGNEPFVMDLSVEDRNFVQTMKDSLGNIVYIEYYEKISEEDEEEDTSTDLPTEEQ